ncbi:hypothetical protein MTO96_043519, partial [Rhipicephalus appendiculatus]
MPPKRKYGRYLWDSSADVPLRSKYRFKRRGLNVGQSASTSHAGTESGDQSSSDSSSEEHESVFPPCASDVDDQDGQEASATVSDENASQHSVQFTSSEASSDETLESDSESASHFDSTSEQPAYGSESELDQVLFPGAKLTRAESFLLIMAHSLRYQCSKEATESLVNLIGAHLPEGTMYPSSKYLFFQQFCGAAE